MVKEKAIMDALLEMGAVRREYGKAKMVSGTMNLRDIADPQAVLGLKVPEATFVTGIDTEPAANDPIYDLGPVSQPKKPRAFKRTKSSTLSIAA
jgi:hypothetical protein